MADSVENSTFSTGSSSRITQSKLFYVIHEPIASIIPLLNTPPYPHTATNTYPRYHRAVSYKALTLARLSLLLLLAARQRGAFLVSLTSSAYDTTAAARGIDPMLPTTAAPAVALAALGSVQLYERSLNGFLLSKSSTRRDERSSSRCSRRKREARSCQPISTAVQQYSLTPTACRNSKKTTKPARLAIRRTRNTQSRKSPVGKGGFRLA